MSQIILRTGYGYSLETQGSLNVDTISMSGSCSGSWVKSWSVSGNWERSGSRSVSRSRYSNSSVSSSMDHLGYGVSKSRSRES